MWKAIAVLFALVGTNRGATVFHCPEGSGCLEATSFKFLDKLGPKDYQTITSLTVANASLDKVPPELKYLKKLEYLDLSDNTVQVASIPSLPHLKTLKLNRNNIKGISLGLLPKNIEDLDLSNNLLTAIPTDWRYLKSLRVLRLNKNLFDCDCYSNNVLNYERLIKAAIEIPDPVICHSPKEFAEKNINSINCPLEDEMINDMGDEGSGFGTDIFSENTEAKSPAPILQEGDNFNENEVISDKDDDLPKDIDFVAVNDSLSTIAPEEGSGGIEGSGFASIEISHIPACHFNCTSPEPIEAHDGNDTDTPLGPKDQMKIIYEDIYGPIFNEPTSSTTTTTPTTEASTTSSTEAAVITEEPIIVKEVKSTLENSHPVVLKEETKNDDAELVLNETRTGEMEKATALNQNNFAVYAVVVGGLLLAVVFMVCLVKKRKAKRLQKNRREVSPNFGDELKPMGKPSVQAINEKNGKSPNNLPEHIPLINGQNGKSKEELEARTYTPPEHPESNHEEDGLEQRSKPELLTPTRERVTIRESEIPESLPKTPVLVHRQKNSDGEIVTTVLPP